MTNELEQGSTFRHGYNRAARKSLLERRFEHMPHVDRR